MKQKQKNPKAPKAVNYWLLVDGFTPAAPKDRAAAGYRKVEPGCW